MATANELFRTANYAEPHIVIDGSRKVNVPEELKYLGVQYDHNIETVIFDCPRYWDGNDLSTLDIYINYTDADGVSGTHRSEDVSISPEDENLINFSWTIKQNLTLKAGEIAFIVCAQKTTDEATVEQCWHSRLCTSCEILPGLECTDESGESSIVIPDNFDLSGLVFGNTDFGTVQLKSSLGLEVFPTTKTSAVYDEKGKRLSEILLDTQTVANNAKLVADDARAEISNVQLAVSEVQTTANNAQTIAENVANQSITTYTHTAGTLTGTGENGKFKATETETLSTINVNGTDCTVNCGGESEVELIADAWYTFILDGNTINFKSGGGLSNSKLALATAVESTVLAGNTFYAGDKTLRTGIRTRGVSGTFQPGKVSTTKEINIGFKPTVVVVLGLFSGEQAFAIMKTQELGNKIRYWYSSSGGATAETTSFGDIRITDTGFEYIVSTVAVESTIKTYVCF